ncbi:hypothetical protein LOK49_LG10G00542 [Camellia lanceoleosa]|uniref:Uncharacterized protein n=1 Tax=Camellia lanceoleosa TaxID=1840588 RepID=A0ACC0GCB1_9ERIC|nr:hypothetical protein LOK49_LG10G00542 [Camellia lanceoleosa]
MAPNSSMKALPHAPPIFSPKASPPTPPTAPAMTPIVAAMTLKFISMKVREIVKFISMKEHHRDADANVLCSLLSSRNLKKLRITASVVRDNVVDLVPRYLEALGCMYQRICKAMLSSITISESCLIFFLFASKLLAAGPVPWVLSIPFNQLKHPVFTKLRFDDVDQMSCVLCLLRSSPYLKKHRITASAVRDNVVESVPRYLEALGCMYQLLNQL